MTKVKCIHFWEIEDGRLGRPVSVGIYQHCKEQKEFANWVDHQTMVEDKKGKEKSTELWRQNFALSGSSPKLKKTERKKNNA